MVETRAENAAKHPGLAVVQAKAVRRSSAEVAQERRAKQEKKEALAAAKEAQVQRREEVTALASIQNAAYLTPVVEKASKKRRAPLKRTESYVNLDDLFAQEANKMDIDMPPPLPPSIQPKRKSTKASAALDNDNPAQSETAPKTHRNANTPLPTSKANPINKARSRAAAPAHSKAHIVIDSDDAASTRPQAKHQSAPAKPTELLPAKSKARSDGVAVARPVGPNGQPIGYRIRPDKKAPAASGDDLCSHNPMDVDIQLRGEPPAGTVDAPSAGKHAQNLTTQFNSGADSRVGGSQKARATANIDDSVTEASSDAQDRAAIEDSVTEDDSDVVKYVDVQASETEESDQPPPPKKTKTGDRDEKATTKQAKKVEGGKQGSGKRRSGKAKQDAESSEVEIVDESSVIKAAKKELGVKKGSTATAAPGKRSSHQMSAQDKINGGIKSRCVPLPFSDTRLYN